ncbi:pyridoxamine 5'-phosphate oxidase [Candidatus Marinamargulisbacteria bacterium SCGC AG-333-B06]|nr:pyridoxamine 5'-phosphate oxidase [Candidatus Marinamargulisbacteria bacterium SCGC AG-333-B06]
MDFHDLDHIFREDYVKGSLLETDVDPNPMDQFKIWFNDIVDLGNRQPNAMVLSTVSVGAVPSSRVVLLKDVTDEGFVFFTNYMSDKGQAIAVNNHVSLLFYSIELERQIHISGFAHKLSYADSNHYFQSRPFESQVAAIASHQSTLIESREDLEAEFKRHFDVFMNQQPACPDYWGGYLVKPVSFEFWQGRKSRFHDRICYQLNDTVWDIFRKAP